MEKDDLNLILGLRIGLSWHLASGLALVDRGLVEAKIMMSRSYLLGQSPTTAEGLGCLSPSALESSWISPSYFPSLPPKDCVASHCQCPWPPVAAGGPLGSKLKCLGIPIPPRWLLGFPGGSDTKESACSAGDLGSIPGSGRSSRERNGNSLQYSCLENSMDGGAWWAAVHGVTKELDMTERLTL